MGETWSKVRSFLSGGFTAEEMPSDHLSGKPTPRSERATPPPVYRDVPAPAVDASGDLLRAVDAKADLLRGRLDALESRVREQPTQPRTAASAEPIANERLAAVSGEVAAMRETIAELSKQHLAARSLAEELARHVADLAKTLAAVDERSKESARDVRDVQATAEEAQAASEASASQLQEWMSVRERTFGQRLAPLYVLSLIALLAALGAAAMTAFRMME